MPLSPQLTAAPLQDSIPLTPCFPLATSSPIGIDRNPREWAGFKIVIDNIDMNLRPRHQTFERQTQSIHYVNAYAVRDRIDFKDESAMLTLENTTVSADSLLFSVYDRASIMTNFVILAGRILYNAIPALQSIPNLLTEHIKHSQYKEMSSKSQTVSDTNAHCM